MTWRALIVVLCHAALVLHFGCGNQSRPVAEVAGAETEQSVEALSGAAHPASTAGSAGVTQRPEPVAESSGIAGLSGEAPRIVTRTVECVSPPDFSIAEKDYHSGALVRPNSRIEPMPQRDTAGAELDELELEIERISTEIRKAADKAHQPAAQRTEQRGVTVFPDVDSEPED